MYLSIPLAQCSSPPASMFATFADQDCSRKQKILNLILPSDIFTQSHRSIRLQHRLRFTGREPIDPFRRNNNGWWSAGGGGGTAAVFSRLLYIPKIVFVVVILVHVLVLVVLLLVVVGQQYPAGPLYIPGQG